MDMKIKLLAVTSMVVVMASGCSNGSYRGASQTGGVNNGANTGTGSSGSSQSLGRVFGQSQRSNTAAVGNDSCAVCAASKTQDTYTYKPAQATATAQPQVQTGSHNQQYYIDRWNREQAQGGQAQQPAQQQQNYAGYGQPGQQQSNTTYYDYSSAARANTQAPANNVASNKSIYTGSYQQSSYTPNTYSGGSAATTNSGVANTVAVASSGGGGSSYAVKKGDTVFEIMRQTGVYWKDIISINNLQAPYSISPGQTLRLK